MYYVRVLRSQTGRFANSGVLNARKYSVAYGNLSDGRITIQLLGRSSCFHAPLHAEKGAKKNAVKVRVAVSSSH